MMEKFLITFYLEAPLTMYGGGEKIAIDLCNHIRMKGYAAEIVDNIRDDVKIRVSESYTTKVCNCPVRRGEFINSGFLSKIYQPMPTFKEIKSFERLAIIFIRRIPPTRYLTEIDKNRVKTIFALHGIALEKIRFGHPLIIAHQILIRLQLIRLAHMVNKNLVVQSLTENVTEYLIKHGAPRNRVVTIGNGIESVKYKVGRNDDIFTITFIGRIENLQKGIKRLLSIARILYVKEPKIQFEIIGTGKDDSLLRHVPPNVNVLGFVDEKSKLNSFEKANLLVITSNLEPFSIVAIEGLFSGIPIVSTPVSGPMQIISSDSEFGKLITFSPKDIARILYEYYLIWNSGKKEYFDAKIRRSNKAKKLFDKSLMLESYEKLIQIIT